MNSQELRSLQEAYLDVYQVDEVTSADYAAVAKNKKPRSAASIQARYHARRLSKPEPETGRKSSRPSSPLRSKMTQDTRDAGRLASEYGSYDEPGYGSSSKGSLPKGKKLERQKKTGVSAESYDIYDFILSHLLDEGYAETSEAAEAIMVNMSEEWRDDIVEGRVPWNDPKNPNPSGYTPKEKSEAKRNQLGVDNPNTSSFENGGPGEKEYARHGNLSATQQKMSKRGQQPKGKPHEFRKNPFWKKTEGQMRRIMGTKVPEDKKDSYPSKN